MKRLLLFFTAILTIQTISWSQCPGGSNIDSDGDGVLDCIDPCVNMASSKIGNLSFESDFIGWTIPQNQSFFSINSDTNNTLHGDKSLYITAPNASVFENHAIYSEEFILEEGVAYNFKIPAKRIGNVDGDALRWVLIDENGVYRHFNNYYNFTEGWSNIEFTNFYVNFSVHTSNKFRLRLEFGLSTTDMVVDKIEFYETSQGEDPAYADYDSDGVPDCGNIDTSNHPDYMGLVALYNALNGQNWFDNTNWLDTTKPLSSWFGITETNGRVTGISLDSNNLSGTIPESFGNLINLETFSIRINGVYGSLPESIVNLTKIQYFDINSNNIVGIIAPWIGIYTDLWYYDIGWNFITGNIPEDLTTLDNLQYAYLHNNNLTGSLPSSNIPLNLLAFDASNNNLTGTVPNFSFIPTLTFLNISGNEFEFADLETNYSDIDNSLGANFVYSPQRLVDNPINEVLLLGESRTLMTNVSGSQNSYTWSRINADGSEGGVIGNNQTVDITINTIDDYKWYYFYEATSALVPDLTLRSNFFKFSESPTTHPDYDALIAIYNALNGIDWDITKPIHNWSSNFDIGFDPVTDRVTSLGITGNTPITGTIPPEIGDLTELTYLDFFLEDLSGEIPIEIWGLTKLKTLFLGAQSSKQLLLTNGIPPEIANLQDLEWLNLTQIPLTQPLQPELFNLPNLIRLRIVECGLTGSLPKELAQISDVLAGGNEFEGAIPQEFLDAIGNTNLNIVDNYFNFANLEPLVQANNYQSLYYSPQRTKDIAQNLDFAPGSNIVLNIDDTSLGKTTSSKGIGDEYQWYKNDIAINGANAISYTINNAQESDSGVYYCIITNPLLVDLIVQRANIILNIDTALSIDEPISKSIKIYPNPTKNILNIKLINTNKANANLYDLNGRLILKHRLQSKESIIDIENLNNGIYLIKIETENKSVTQRIVKR